MTDATAEATRTVEEIAQEFTDLCRQGEFDEAGAKYWSDNVVSLEPGGGDMARCEGRQAVQAKGEWWSNAHETHGFEVGQPVVNDNQFMVNFKMDVTNKESGMRMQMDEQALYTVDDGKIVEERFFYPAPPQG